DRVSPSEILISPDQDFSFLASHALQPYDHHTTSIDECQSTLTNHFNIKSLGSFGLTSRHDSEIIAAALLIDYLQDTQKTQLLHIKSIKQVDLEGNMMLDLSTIRNLDLLETQS